MSAILMDSWGLESALGYLLDWDSEQKENISNNGHSNAKKAWANFLTALLLWDEVWQTQFLKIRAINVVYESCVERKGEELFDLVRHVFDDLVHDIFTEIPSDLQGDFSLNYRTTDAEKYLLLSNAIGVNYLPHPNRNQEVNSFVNKKTMFSRQDLMNLIEKDVVKLYNEIEQELGKTILDLSVPISYEYIHKKSMPKYPLVYNEIDMAIAELNTALELRENKDVIEYRRSMSYLEEIAAKGNALYIKQAIDVVHDVSKQIFSKKEIGKTRNINFSMALSPSINLITGILSASVSSGISIPIKLRKRNYNIHTTFLSDLIKYGATGETR